MMNQYRLVHYCMWNTKDDEKQLIYKDIYKAIDTMKVIAIVILNNRLIDIVKYNTYLDNITILEANGNVVNILLTSNKNGRRKYLFLFTKQNFHIQILNKIFFL